MRLPLSASAETLARIDAVRSSPTGRRVAVLGLGIVGRAMARYFLRRGANVLGFDTKAGAGAELLSAAGFEQHAGDVAPALLEGVELLCLSPGADPRQLFVQTAMGQGIAVCGELELCGQLPARVIAITGTNGKSTTTALGGALVRGCGARAFVGGNLGDPIIAWLDRGEPADVAVVELSSFQLETAYRFRTDAAIVLNVTPDHTDRYPDIATYARTKQRLVECVSEHGVAVLSADDPMVRAMAPSCPGRVWWFSTRQTSLPGDGVTVEGDTLIGHGVLSSFGPCDLSHPRLMGRHNRENAAAAFLAAHALGFAPDHASALLSGYLEFPGLPHRLELVGEVAGVQYINDSKATNDDAASIALRAMQRPVVLLVGGRSKKAGYEATVREAKGRARLVIAFGEARDEIAAAFRGQFSTLVEPTLRSAFEVAKQNAKAGEAVLLAPACSSFDEFRDYADRGRTFGEWVRQSSQSQAQPQAHGHTPSRREPGS